MPSTPSAAGATDSRRCSTASPPTTPTWIELRVLSGGLFTGPRALPLAAYPHVPGANARIAELTGVTFGAAYQEVLVLGRHGHGLHRRCDRAARPDGPARSQCPRCRRGDAAPAWYVDGRSLSDAEVYRDIAIELGLDATLVVAAYNDSATRAASPEAQFVEVGLLGVDSYPTLLVHTAHGTRRLGGPTSSAAALTRAPRPPPGRPKRS